jgi:hypothetical protein
MEQPISIDVELIATITGLPSMGENPASTWMTKPKRRHWLKK